MNALRAGVIAALALGCGTNRPEIPPELLETPSGCSVFDYPAGPYGTEPGAVAADACFRGWSRPDMVQHEEGTLQNLSFGRYYDPAGERFEHLCRRLPEAVRRQRRRRDRLHGRRHHVGRLRSVLGPRASVLFLPRQPLQGAQEPRPRAERQFVGVALEQPREQVLLRSPKPLRQYNDAIPKAIEDVCLGCLEKDPAQRPATAGDVAAALQLTLESAKRYPARQWAIAIGLAGLAIVVAFVVSLITSNKRAEEPIGAVAVPNAVGAAVPALLNDWTRIRPGAAARDPGRHRHRLLRRRHPDRPA